MGSKISPIFQRAILLGLVATFAACSSNNDSRKITVDAGFTVRHAAPYDLSQTLTHMMVVSPTPGVCLQNQIFLVLHDHTTDQMLSVQPINLYSNVGPLSVPASLPAYTTAPTDIDKVIDWIVNYSYIQSPLSLTLPSGSDQLEVGIMGHFFYPVDNNLDGICDQLTNSTPPLAVSSTALFGRASLTLNQSGSLPLYINTLHTNPTGIYSMTNPIYVPHPDYWTQFDFGFNSGAARLKKISYLNGLINISVDNTGNYINGAYYVPNLFPGTYSLTFSDAGGVFTSTITNPSQHCNSGGCSSAGSSNAVMQNPALTAYNSFLTSNYTNGVVSGVLAANSAPNPALLTVLGTFTDDCSLYPTYPNGTITYSFSVPFSVSTAVTGTTTCASNNIAATFSVSGILIGPATLVPSAPYQITNFY